MDGVTILNSYEHLTNFGSIFAISIFFGCFLAGSIVSLFVLLKYKCNSWMGFTILVICVTLTIIYGCFIPKKEYETRYQVTVDNSISMNEFQNKYEIIKVEGKIYTVHERK